MLDQMEVPWSCRGALLWSMSTGLASACNMHASMSTVQRMECAVTGFVLFDLWSLLSARMEAEHQCAVGSMGIAAETTQNIQAVCLSTVGLLLDIPEALL